MRALKFHGGVEVKNLNQENTAALIAGMANLEKHLTNLQHAFNLPVVVAINHFDSDSDAEITCLQAAVAKLGAQAVVCKHWAQGADGAVDLADAVLRLIASSGDQACRLLYPDAMPLADKIKCVAQQIYGASQVEFSPKALASLASLEKHHGHFPVCIAKTQYSFSSDPTLRGAPTGHVLTVRELRLSRGAEFVVVVCGDIMTMPGLPKQPASERIAVDQAGHISGLS